jgi:hypothetical protein
MPVFSSDFATRDGCTIRTLAFKPYFFEDDSQTWRIGKLPKFMIGILWAAGAALWAVTEVFVVLVFQHLPSAYVFFGVGTKYAIALIVALPMIAGLNGYYSTRRRIQSINRDVVSIISSQFLIATVIAYVTILFCIGPLAMALKSFLK